MSVQSAGWNIIGASTRAMTILSSAAGSNGLSVGTDTKMPPPKTRSEYPPAAETASANARKSSDSTMSLLRRKSVSDEAGAAEQARQEGRRGRAEGEQDGEGGGGWGRRGRARERSRPGGHSDGATGAVAAATTAGEGLVRAMAQPSRRREGHEAT